MDGPLAPGAAVVLVWAESAEDAWGRIVRARTEQELEESRLLAGVFARASEDAVEVVAGGPYPRLNEQVLLDALASTPRDLLPGLRLIYVSPEPPGEKLRQVLSRRRSGWTHRPWRGDPPR